MAYPSQSYRLPQTVQDVSLLSRSQQRPRSAFSPCPRSVTDRSQLDIHQSSNFKGYTALLSENVNINNKGDLHEGFDIGWESMDHTMQMTGPNVWPDDLPGFRQDVLAY